MPSLKQTLLLGATVLAIPLVAILLAMKSMFADRLSFSPNFNSIQTLETSKGNDLIFDYIVVGAGSAGCLVANRLSASPSNKVLVLEAGSSDNDLGIKLPPAFSELFKTPKDWAFMAEPDATIGNRRIFYPRGRCIGGTSSLNANMYLRGSPTDFDEWESKIGLKGWNYQTVLPYFKKTERNLRSSIDTQYHGVQGDVVVDDAAQPNPIMKRVVKGMSENLNLKHVDDLNAGPLQNVVGFTQVTITKGQRYSSADSFLSPEILSKRSNLHIATGAQVMRIIFDENKAATGVEVYFEETKTRRVFKASREIVLSAGAIMTPKILLNSGVGPAEHLAKVQVPLVADLPGVGQNLQDHPAVVLSYNITKPEGIQSQLGLVNLVRWIATGTGPLTTNVPEISAFVKSKYAAKDDPYDIQMLAAPAFFQDNGFRKFPGDGFSIGGYVLQPENSGTIELASNDPLARPVIKTNYFKVKEGAQSSRDLDLLVEIVKMSRKAIAHGVFKDLVDYEVVPGPHVQTDDEIKQFIKETCVSLHHLVGSCRMGTDAMGVLDGELRVKGGVSKLRVADASAIPINLRANSNAATLMIAERVSEFILKQQAATA